MTQLFAINHFLLKI